MRAIRFKKWMLYRLLMLAVCLAAFPAVADDFAQLRKPRAFTLRDDKTVTLKVLDWNPQRKKFHVENSNGKKGWVAPGSFSDADQAYFKDWISAHWFLSNNKLYVSAKREAKGGYVFYKITIHNKTAVDYSKVVMNYEVERVWDNYESEEQEEKNVPGKIFIGLIKAGAHKSFTTQPVKAGETYGTVYSPKPVLVRSGVSYTYTNEVPYKTGKEKVTGARLKIQGPKLDNVLIVREVHIDK